MLKIRCKNCNKELESHPTKTRCCGCDNMTMVKDENISANDLSLVEIVSHNQKIKKPTYLTNEDIEWQEARKKRKVKKLEFEIK
jgi:hypothetical protein